MADKKKYQALKTESEKLDALREIIDSSQHIVFLGGAGVSTESGIPDFRGKDGLYRKKDKKFGRYKPEYLLSADCLQKKPEVFFDYFRKNLDVREIQPNAAHLKLAELYLFPVKEAKELARLEIVFAGHSVAHPYKRCHFHDQHNS